MQRSLGATLLRRDDKTFHTKHGGFFSLEHRDQGPTCSLEAAVPEMLPWPSQTYRKPFHALSIYTATVSVSHHNQGNLTINMILALGQISAHLCTSPAVETCSWRARDCCSGTAQPEWRAFVEVPTS